MEITYRLSLEWCSDLKNVLQLNPKGMLYNLKSLDIRYSREMEYVVNVEEQVPETMFPNLVELELYKVSELKATWNGPLVESECSAVPNVTMLQNLEEIQIEDCPKLEKVFEDGSASIFKLRSIQLHDLDSLTSIWKGAVPLIRLESLKILDVKNYPSLRSRYLFLSVAFAQRFQQLEELEVIKCQSFIQLIAEEAEGMEINSSSIFSNLKMLDIKVCQGLKCIFPIRIFQGLMQLEEFKVSWCREMEELFEFEECQEKEEGSMTIRLPRLRILVLQYLPRLTSFFSHRRNLPCVLLDCPSLEEFDISECPNLKRLPFGPRSTPKLEKFYINDVEWFEKLEWDDPSVKLQLQQLLLPVRCSEF
ncbi:hypothetical protein GIB67_004108 [Kingdonia uniflora]|uniref:Disease resistance protein At4g27190-like leucine-rich repeats domain-containing protein n=1 Tax=Kingdonia uniflora TaxID=39325 RepID=A0A7J7NRA7_9MAGN|nr:hypothetical protein GIB67_040578 [Kingdonia uniflora]KAF6169716.1 hypothetical protein GIB67_004108 [Kingdonia uniflora]